MAIYHLSAQIITRSKGHSATAAAAYRARCVIEDQRTGKKHDYTRAEGAVLFEQTLAPKGSPEWAFDREQLFNRLEVKEKRADAQLSREFNVAIPHELTEQQGQWLVKNWTDENFVKSGYAVDIAIHAPHEYGDVRNLHAHIQVPLRPIDGQDFGKKPNLHPMHHGAQLEQWRESWERQANHMLARFGHEERIDRRSLADQGSDREPTIHLGKTTAALERQGVETDRGDEQLSVALRLVGRAVEMRQSPQEQPALEPDVIDPATLRPHELAMHIELLQNQERKQERRDEMQDLQTRIEAIGGAPGTARPRGPQPLELDLIAADMEGRAYSLIPTPEPAAARPADPERLGEFLDLTGQLRAAQVQTRAERQEARWEQLAQREASQEFNQERAEQRAEQRQERAIQPEAYERPAVRLSNLRPAVRLGAMLLENVAESAGRIFGVALDMMCSLFEPTPTRSPGRAPVSEFPREAIQVEAPPAALARPAQAPKEDRWEMLAKREKTAEELEREWRLRQGPGGRGD